ncbi:MAG: hypothetical protein ACJ0BO_01875 [Candidatus Puniceispirillaceae bacterium]
MASDRDKPDGFFVIGSAEAEAWLAPAVDIGFVWYWQIGGYAVKQNWCFYL